MTAVVSEQRTQGNSSASKTNGEKAENKEDENSEVTVTNYEVSKTTETLNDAVGTIKRLSVAVLLDGNYRNIVNNEGVEQTIYEPRPLEEVDRLASIVKNAVGFSSDRDDQIEIVNIAFDKSYLNDQQKTLDNQYSREFYYDIIKKVVIALLLIGLALWLRKRIKNFFAGLAKILPPAPRPAAPRSARAVQAVSDAVNESPPIDDAEEIIPEKRQLKLVDRMQKVAKDEPEEIAKVIKTMMVE